MKLIKLAAAVGAASLLCSAQAWAADCGAASTQTDMTQCAGKKYAEADKQLNTVYNAYRARLNAAQKKQFTQAQLAWIRFRDLSCAFESSGVEGGSAYPMVRNICLAGKTAERAKEIEVLGKCEEGDLSCPVHR